MEMPAIIGLGLTILSGIIMTCAIVPMKFARKWKWENIWLLYIGFGQVVFPLLLIWLTAPKAWAVLANAKFSAVAAAILFGLGWGIGNVLSGIGYTMLGVGLGLTIILSLTASMGSLIPLAVLYPERLASTAAVALYFGVAVMLVGLIACYHAGNLRQRHQPRNEIAGGADLQAFGKGDLRTGVLICVASGILSSMVNLAFTFGDGIRTTALRFGMAVVRMPVPNVNAKVHHARKNPQRCTNAELEDRPSRKPEGRHRLDPPSRLVPLTQIARHDSRLSRPTNITATPK